MNSFQILYCVFLSLSLLDKCYGLECYVCTDQDNNGEKCLNTIKTCDPDEDVCQTVIRWGSTPYFSLGAKKQYYVSKRCSTKSKCHKYRSRLMQYCTHIWYEDWSCSECCQGDRCNYYVISGAISGFNPVIIYPVFLVLSILTVIKHFC